MPLSAGEGAKAWALMAEWACYSLAWLGLPVGLLVGLSRYRLYDADSAISRSATYGIVTVSLLAIFAASENAIQTFGQAYFGNSLGSFAGGLGAAAAAAMVGPIHSRVTGWAERNFRSGLVHLRLGLPLLVGDMRETATPQVLADAMLERVESGVHARHGAVVVDNEILDLLDIDEETVRAWLATGSAPTEGFHRLHVDRKDALFPMRVPLHADGVGLVGWMLLGPRPDGSFYGREERETLGEIAGPVARALAITIARQTSESARAARETGLRQEVRALRNLVDRVTAHLGLEAERLPHAGL